MVYIDLLTTNLQAEPCTEISLGNGTFSYQKQDGDIYTVTPDGITETRPSDAVGQPWQIFKKANNALVAERVKNINGKDVNIVYLRPYVEVK